jgi:hypothetical protein
MPAIHSLERLAVAAAASGRCRVVAFGRECGIAAVQELRQKLSLRDDLYSPQAASSDKLEADSSEMVRIGTNTT